MLSVWYLIKTPAEFSQLFFQWSLLPLIEQLKCSFFLRKMSLSLPLVPHALGIKPKNRSKASMIYALYLLSFTMPPSLGLLMLRLHWLNFPLTSDPYASSYLESSHILFLQRGMLFSWIILELAPSYHFKSALMSLPQRRFLAQIMNTANEISVRLSCKFLVAPSSFIWCVCMRAQLCPTLGPPWTVALQALLSMEFSRQE